MSRGAEHLGIGLVWDMDAQRLRMMLALQDNVRQHVGCRGKTGLQKKAHVSGSMESSNYGRDLRNHILSRRIMAQGRQRGAEKPRKKRKKNCIKSSNWEKRKLRKRRPCQLNIHHGRFQHRSYLNNEKRTKKKSTINLLNHQIWKLRRSVTKLAQQGCSI
jgi:hypothetical protein